MQKAEQDRRGARALAKLLRTDPMPDLICFHVQQCVEKYLKGLLVLRLSYFAKTHDLEKLVDIALAHGIDGRLKALRRRIGRLTKYAVAFRYPMMQSTPEEARRAVRDMEAIRRALRKCLGLP